MNSTAERTPPQTLPLLTLPVLFHGIHVRQTCRWEAYNLATDHLSPSVKVAPDRARAFERTAAWALLLPEGEGVIVRPNP